MVRGWMNDELEIIWKKMAVAEYETMSRGSVGRAEEKYKAGFYLLDLDVRNGCYYPYN
jgi:hypothetical protein